MQCAHTCNLAGVLRRKCHQPRRKSITSHAVSRHTGHGIGYKTWQWARAYAAMPRRKLPLSLGAYPDAPLRGDLPQPSWRTKSANKVRFGLRAAIPAAVAICFIAYTSPSSYSSNGTGELAFLLVSSASATSKGEVFTSMRYCINCNSRQ